MEDALLLDGLAQKNEQAYSAVYRKYAKLLYARAYHILRDKLEAEEVVQDFFVNHVLKFSKWEQVYNLKYYLQKGVQNLSFIYIERHKRAQHHKAAYMMEKYAAGPNGEEPVTFQPAMESFEKNLLHQLLSSLSEQQQTALRLAHVEKCGYREIASIMKVSHNTVKTHLRLARKNIGKYEAYFKAILHMAILVVLM